MRALSTAITLALLTTTACSDDDPSPADTTSPDTAADADTALPDTALPDTALPDTALPDTAAPDTALPDTADCDYLDNPVILQCGQALRQFSLWEDFANPAACAPYYAAGDDRYPTAEALAQAEGCEEGCVYIAFQAVDFIRCDGQGRSGFETFTASGEGCLESVYRTADGLFTDLCLWATYNCYCTEDPG